MIRQKKDVSILVLLEVSFRPLSKAKGNMYSWGFNPCFIGSIFQTFVLRRENIVFKSFNPCFIGSIFQTGTTSWSADDSRHGFNPCFIGSIFQTSQKVFSFFLRESFNPCFIGSIFQTLCRMLTQSFFSRFQSLFYWKYLSDGNLQITY